MKRSILRQVWHRFALLGVAALLTGCGDGGKSQKEVKRLSEELSDLRYEIEGLRADVVVYEQDLDKASQELNEATSKLQDMERRAQVAERDLERYRKLEESAAKAKEDAPSREEMKAAALTAAGEHLGAMVTVGGDQSSGTGLIVEAAGRTWIYLPADILVGNSKLEVTRPGGARLEKFGDFEVALGTGLARLEVKEPVELALKAAGKVELERGAMLMGVTEAGDLFEGRSYGAEAGVMKVGSDFSKCRPGSPLFDGGSGDLLGILIEAPDDKRSLWERPGRDRPGMQSTALELGAALRWEKVPVAGFLEEARLIDQTDRLTRLIIAFAGLRPTSQGVNLDGLLGDGRTSARTLFEENAKMSVVRSLMDLDEWLKTKGDRAAKSDASKRIDSVFSAMKHVADRDTRDFSARKFSACHAKTAEESLEWRNEAVKQLDAAIAALAR